MTKKIISIVAIIAVLAIGYFAIKNGNIKPANTQTDGSAIGPSEEELANLPLPEPMTDDAVELTEAITVEVKLSSNSTGVGFISFEGDKKNSCYLTKVTDKCDYAITEAMKLVAVPVEGFVFRGWFGGCDNITTTNLKNDTCEIGAHSSKKVIEVGFMKS